MQIPNQISGYDTTCNREIWKVDYIQLLMNKIANNFLIWQS